MMGWGDGNMMNWGFGFLGSLFWIIILIDLNVISLTPIELFNRKAANTAPFQL